MTNRQFVLIMRILCIIILFRWTPEEFKVPLMAIAILTILRND